jgi:nucleotide-binding universal stress UspA family protein
MKRSKEGGEFIYKKVLVPLDGSALAECALPEVKRLAQCGCVGEVLLVNVVEDPMRGAMEGMEALNLVEIENRLHDHARKYLADIKIKLNAENSKASPEVLCGRAAQSIVDYAKENGVDLIIIASHGYTGVKKWVFGNVALRVLHDAHAPVLLIRPESHQLENH